MQAAAPVDGILVGEQTYRATRDAIEYRAVAPVEAKGRVRADPGWEALRHTRRSASVSATSRGRRSSDGSASSISARLGACTGEEERSPQLVTLVGVPGIGKSRLVFELSRIVGQDREPITWRQGRCLPYGDGVSFWALGEAVKAQVGIWNRTVQRRPRRSCEARSPSSSPRPTRRGGSRSSCGRWSA